MPCQPREVHLISHAHWDREWYQPFQGFRRRLVGTIDDVLRILETDPAYAYFWLDGQTIVLEDYLEIRPENEPRLRRLIAAGKIGVGPWYCQPDEALVSGEALVRNLLKGHRIAASYGHAVPKIGYVPDIFGHTSQLPQIFAGFGIDNAFLWRGVACDGFPTEMAWEGADGTHVLVVRFNEKWGYSDWMLEVRRRFLGKDADPDALVEATRDFLDYKAARATTPVILGMDGCDHTEPDPRLPQWLALLRQRFPGIEFIHSSPERYLERLRQVMRKRVPTQVSTETQPLEESASPHVETRVGARKPQMLHGELRLPAKDLQAGDWLLNGVLSSRIHLKQQNELCQTLLERWAEPTATLAAIYAGAPYPAGFLRTAWRFLLQNHPHDSICGCSIDQVHKDMVYRFDQAALIADEATGEAVSALTAGIGVAEGTPGENLLVLFNPSPIPIERTVLVDLELPFVPAAPAQALQDPNRCFVAVYDAEGKAVPTQLCAISRHEPRWSRQRSGTPEGHFVDRLTVALRVQAPACGYASYTYGRRPEPHRALGSMAAGPAVWEGRFLRLSVNANGSVNLLDKQTGAEYRELLTWEDVGDIGDGWNHYSPVHDRRVTSAAAAATVSEEYGGPLFTRLRIDCTLRVPAAAAPDGLARSQEEVGLPITAWLDFPYDARRIDIRVHVENTARDHALRALFPSGRSADRFYTDAAFDLVERPVHRPDFSGYNETTDEMIPQQSFVAVHDERGGLCVMSRGLPAVNVRPDPLRTIALNLLRGFAKTVMRQGEEGGQVLGPHDFSLSLLPYRPEPGWDASLCQQAAAFRTGLRTHLGVARPGELARAASLLSIEPAALQLSALKAAEDEEGAYILRLYNPTEGAVEGQVRFQRPPRECRLANLNEEPGRALPIDAGGAIPVQAGPKKIVTLLLRFH